MTETAKSSKKIKIAFVSDAIYPYNKGGKEKRLFEVSTRLAKQNFDVTIYCMKWWKSKENIRVENNVKLHAISPLYPLYSGERRSIKEAILFSINCLKLIKEDFDILDIDHMPHLVLFPIKIVCILKRKKFYATWNEVWGREYWVSYMGILGNISYVIERLSVLMPDNIIAVSKHTSDKLKNDLFVKKPIQTIPNGIDIQEIKNVKTSNIISDIIFAGRLLKHKNIDVLIDSIILIKNDYPKIKCLIVGNGPEEKYLKLKVVKSNLKKNVIFLDFMPKHTDVYSLMKSSKVFAFPSTREGFGLVALEANACGIPFITTNHKDNAAKDLLTNEKNGYMVELNKMEMSKKIMECILLKESSNKYLNIAQGYDWDDITKKIINVYKIK